MYRRAALALLVSVMCAGATCLPDADGDGVSDADDSCVNTPICATVGANGCPSDGDDDGVYDGCDECEDTPDGEPVYANGCTAAGSGQPAVCQGADPRAVEIQYSLVNLTTATSGTILVTGVVENGGAADYESSAGQQSVELWADGARVASTDFEDLAVGETVTVEVERTWSTTSELPAVTRYRLLISYDPDIFDDGNPDNDDCELDNNSVLRGTADIATVFE